MARIAGVSIPEEKHIVVGLTAIYGVGPAHSVKILDTLDIPYDKKGKDLSEQDYGRIAEYIKSHYTTEGDLREQVRSNIKRLQEIHSYRGDRHSKHLPVRGQRSKGNSRTVRGNKRMTVATGRPAPAAKT